MDMKGGLMSGRWNQQGLVGMGTQGECEEEKGQVRGKTTMP